ncbi:hypothetical protein PUND_a0775 [Pseudoalteromonas undina]|nr:hypothetical protein PUND_a0775 [Pseudoalteromonas undina]
MKVLAVSRQLHSVNLTIVAWVEYHEAHGQNSVTLTSEPMKPIKKIKCTLLCGSLAL